MAAVSNTDAHLEVGATRGVPLPPRVGGNGATLGVRGLTLCRRRSPATRRARTMSYRAPPGGMMNSALPATREAAGAPSAWSQPLKRPPERPRRWDDAEPPTADQKAGIQVPSPESATCGRGARTTIYPLRHQVNVPKRQQTATLANARETGAAAGTACKRVVDGPPQRRTTESPPPGESPQLCEYLHKLDPKP